ncbi:hypothetical protein BSK63_23595 [Paenibacillus odorifer]|uniref:MAE_28990/MAE_18760 family HEPN-like nuclease n=1 Tax=Paenibacillus odorifer TaxID=189426 RepID=UPI00096CD5A8|nr:MAE_28990/MAE_18760 family HEPN-like nuclease [Paenibacillus odorifer]OME28898.1 hypothetical protein BSK63_23595 [Paenibacillus odorifer]
MRSVLIEFKNGIEQISNFIESIDKHKKTISTYRKAKDKNITPTELEEQIRIFVEGYESFSSKSAFDYNTIVVSLYGYFERFIEDLIKAYISSLKSFVKNFNEMPEKIRMNHSDLSAILIQNLKLPKYQDTIKSENIVINMHSCVIGNVEFEINLDAYTYHTSNFRQGSIDEFYSKVGVENISSKILNSPNFEKYLIENEISKTVAFGKISDLAERRNQVSHGAPVQLLDPIIFIDYLNFFDVYSTCLHQILMIEQIEYRVEKT